MANYLEKLRCYK